jgi:CRISPR-associated protein Csx14
LGRGSSWNSFKLYSGNHSAEQIARAMLKGVRNIERPFHVLTPMGGSFNFDPRGAWTAIGAGYSPDDQQHLIDAPVVEFLAAWGLEHGRPDEFEMREKRYAAWGICLAPMLAPVALLGGLPSISLKNFRFELGLLGKIRSSPFAGMNDRPAVAQRMGERPAIDPEMLIVERAKVIPAAELDGSYKTL